MDVDVVVFQGKEDIVVDFFVSYQDVNLLRAEGVIEGALAEFAGIK